MSVSHTHRHDATSANPSGEDLHPQHRDAHCPQDPRSSAPLKVKKAVEDWPGAGRGQQAGSTEDWPSTGRGQQAGSMDNSSLEDCCSKEKLDERMSLNSSSDSGIRSPLCRICFQGPDQGELISPCRCSGSVRCTHEPCLIKWISERGSWSCELCYYKYHVVNISTKNPLQWQTISLTNIEKVQIAAAALSSLFLLASVSWLVWSSVSHHRWQRQDLFFQICYAMYGFMDWVCIVMIVHEGPSVFRIFHRWQAVNKRRKVLNYNKARDLEEQEEGPDYSPREHPFLPEPNPRMGGLSGGRLVSELPSTSTSSLLAAVAAAEVAATGQVTVWDREEEADSGTSTTLTAMSESEPSSRSNTGQSPSSVFEQNHSYRWTYSLLHVLGQHRPYLEQQNPEPQGLFDSPAQTQPRDSNRELVMRVTTV